jgi:hypothetical protein
MIRSRAKRSRRPQRGASRKIAYDCRDDRLRVLVRILARDAARESFEREVMAQRQTSAEVTVQ